MKSFYTFLILLVFCLSAHSQDFTITSSNLETIVYQGAQFYGAAHYDYGQITVVNNSSDTYILQHEIHASYLPPFRYGNYDGFGMDFNKEYTLNSSDSKTMDVSLDLSSQTLPLADYTIGIDVKLTFRDYSTYQIVKDTIIHMESLLDQPDMVSPTFEMPDEYEFYFILDSDNKIFDYEFDVDIPINNHLFYGRNLVYELTSLEHSNDLNGIFSYSVSGEDVLVSSGKIVVPFGDPFFFTISGYDQNISLDQSSYIKYCAHVYDPLDSLTTAYDYCVNFKTDPSSFGSIDSSFVTGIDGVHCVGDTIEFGVMSGFSDVMWNVNNGSSISSGPTLELIFDSNQSYYISAEAKDSDGLLYQTSFSLSPESPSYTFIDTRLDYNDCSQIKLIPSNSSIGDDVKWYLDDSLVSTENTLNLKAKDISEESIVTIKSNGNGCGLEGASYITRNDFLRESVELVIPEKLCAGETISVTTGEVLDDIVWTIDYNSNNTSYEESVEVEVTNNYLFVGVSGINSKGCFVSNFEYIKANSDSNFEIIDEIKALEKCNQYELISNPGLDEVKWIVNADTLLGNSVVYDFNSDFLDEDNGTVLITSIARNGGCTSSEQRSISNQYNPDKEYPITIGGNTTFCDGSPVTLYAPSSLDQYQWILSESVISRADSAIFPDNVFAGTAVLKALDENGCFVKSEHYVDKLSADLNDLNISVEAVDSLCSEFSILGGSGFTNYKWYVGDDFVGEGRTINFNSFDPFETEQMIRLEASLESCTKQGDFKISRMIEERSDIVDISPLRKSCTGDEVILSASENYKYYKWNTLSSPDFSATSAPVHVGKNYGSFDIKVEDEDGCVFKQSHKEPINVFPRILACNVYTTADMSNMIQWQNAENGYRIDHFKIYRETDSGGTYELIGTVDSTVHSFEDTGVNPNQNANYYYVSTVDVCGQESRQSVSPHFSTIHLTANLGVGDVVNLIWTSNQISEEISQYYIYRGSSLDDLEPLDTVSSKITSYTYLSPSEGENVYAVSALYSNNCDQPNNSQPSFSNAVFLTIVDVNDISETEINIFPNPFESELRMELDDKYKVIIYSSTGNNLWSREMSQGSQKIDLSDFSSGLYIMKIIGKNGHYTIKLLKS